MVSGATFGELVRAKGRRPDGGVNGGGFRMIGKRNAETRFEINRVHNSTRRLDVTRSDLA